MLRFGVLGTGRIGDMHAGLVAAQPDACVTRCFDVDGDRARATAEKVGAQASRDMDEVIGADDVDAVLIASPTNTHVELILRAAQAGKPILCEKPIDVDVAKVEECREKLKDYDVQIQLGFNRRFDPSHAQVQQAVSSGEIGPLELLVITSRDPGPPPPREILEACGGLFRDTTIHDFDMARFVMGEEPVEVYTMAANPVDPVFAELDDVDTAMIVMRAESGALCHINNSRRTNYGYEQRVEALGAEGMVRSNNLLVKSTVTGIIALGLVFVLLVGEIDLSVAATSGVASVLMAKLVVDSGLPIPLAIGIAVLTGMFIGAASGIQRTAPG